MQIPGLFGLKKENSSLLLLLPILIYYLWPLTNDWIPSSDSATYIALGKALISGQGYSYMGYTHVRYPFLFPLILAPITGLFGNNFLLMRLVIIVMGVSSVGLVFLIFKNLMDRRWGLALMLLSAASEFHYFYSHHILSDIPYTFFSLLALWYYIREPKQAEFKSIVALAGLSLLCYFTRSVGLVLFIAILGFRIFEVREKMARTMLFVLIFLIPSGIWAYRNRTVPIQDQFPTNLGETINYFDEFFTRNITDKKRKTVSAGDMGRRILYNINYYRHIATDLTLSPQIVFAQSIRLIPILLVVGFMGNWFKYRTVIEYYILLYVVGYLLWPTWQGVRFYVPIFPFLMYYLLSGIAVIFRWGGKWLKLSEQVKRRTSSIGMVLAVGVLLVLHLKTSWGLIGYLRKKGFYRENVNNFMSSIQWAAENTGQDDIFISDRAPWVYILSERGTYGFARVDNSSEVLKSILIKKPDYLITSRVTGYSRYLDDVLTDYPHLFSEIFRQGDSAVYQVEVNGDDYPARL